MAHRAEGVYFWKDTMKLVENIEIVDLTLLIKNNLVISDTQFGYEEQLNAQGVLVPRQQYNLIEERLKKIFTSITTKLKYENIKKVVKGEKVRSDENITKNINNSVTKNLKKEEKTTENEKLFNKIIINGDIKHEFGKILETEWRYLIRFFDFLNNYCNEIILIKGNHDLVLSPVARKRNIHIVDYYILDNILLTHGDKIVKDIKKIKTIIIGHEHPAISLRKDNRVEKYKCFLKGTYKGKTLVVQPSFNPLVEGSDITKEEILSPYLNNLDNFDVFVVEDKIYGFGKVKNLLVD